MICISELLEQTKQTEKTTTTTNQSKQTTNQPAKYRQTKAERPSVEANKILVTLTSI